MRTLVAISLLILLVSSTVVTPGAAQGTGSSGSGLQSDTPLVSDTIEPVVIATDPTGDAGFGFSQTPPEADVTESSAHVDIIELKMAESESAVLLSIKHAGYPDLSGELSKVPLGTSLRCSVSWDLNDGEALRYRTNTWLQNTDSAWQLTAYASVSQSEDEFGWDSYFLGELETALVASDHIEVVLPKVLLEQAVGRPFRNDDRFDNFEMYCTGGQTAFGIAYDDIRPDETPTKAFPLKLTATTDKIAMSLAGELMQQGSQQVAVGVGTTTKLAVMIENLAGNKLLVNITAALVDTTGQPLDDWKIQVAPTFEVSAGRTVPASVLITPPDDVQHRSAAILKVRGIALGFPGEAKLSSEIVAIQGPTVQHNTLYFHNWDGYGYFCGGICGAPAGTTDQVFDEDEELFLMNVLSEDPVYDRTAQDSGPVSLFSYPYGFAMLDAPLPRPVRFDGDGTVDFTITVRSDVPRDVRLRATLFGDYDNGAIAHFDESFAITDTFTAYTFSVPVREEDIRLPKGASLYLEDFTLLDDMPIRITSGNTFGTIQLDPSGTQMVLPLLEVVEQEIKITDGRFLPSMALANNTDPEEYVNPGNSRSFDLDLLNEGIEGDIVTLEAEISDPAWKVTFEPGRSFELEPGRAAPLCVTATAPDDAKEGDVVTVNLTARSKSDPDVTTSGTLTLLVVTQIPIDDDPCVEVEEERFVKPLELDQKESPAAGLLLPLTLVGLVAALRRRLGTA